ncbi:unnamed protein product [Meganyctiphanes norvegica]|uniref:WAP domain-containing protein n=1 Tax=Meganyctiphanes norvegica TaxID=48144 RepID=A0AAV2PN48_MEGNR
MFFFILLSIFFPSLGQNITEAPTKPMIAAPAHHNFISPFYRHHQHHPLAWGGFGLQHPHFRALPFNHVGVNPYPHGVHASSLYGSLGGSPHCAYFCTLPTGHYGCCDSAATTHPGTCPVNPPRSECPADRRIGTPLLSTTNRRSDTRLGLGAPLRCNVDVECAYSHRCCWDICAGYRTCKPTEFRG